MRWVALSLLASVAFADDWAAFGEKEWSNGPHRLVINESGFQLLDGGKLVAKGRLPQLPLDVHVLANGTGAVLFERYAAIGHGDTLAFLGADGALRWRLSLDQAIPGGAGGAPVTISSIRWQRGWWVDEARGKALLVAMNGVLSEVDLKTGNVAKGGKEAVLSAFALPWARDAAIEIAVGMKPEDMPPGALCEAADKLLADRSLSPVSYLRAAVAVEKCTGPPVTIMVSRRVWEAALDDDVAVADRQAAVAFAGKYVWDLSLLEKAALRKDVGMQAVTALGERKRTNELAGLLTNSSIDREVRAHAAELLGGLPAGDVLDAIDREMEDAGAEEGGALLSAAIATGAPDLEKRLQHHESVLLKILDKETSDVAWLANYFRGRPTSEAVRPLVKALARHKSDPALRGKLIAALKPCSGEDYGGDADAWIKALGRR